MYGFPRKNASPVPNNIIAIPTAISLTRWKLQSQLCKAPSTAPANPAHKTPSHGDPAVQ